MKEATSVQLAAQLMQRLRGMHVARSRLHGPLELPKRVPPAPLLEIDAPKVHERELPRLVASRLLGLPQPGDGLVGYDLADGTLQEAATRLSRINGLLLSSLQPPFSSTNLNCQSLAFLLSASVRMHTR